MKTAVALAILLLPVPGVRAGEIVKEMTPALIQQALEWGATQKNAPTYRLKGPRGRFVSFDTPYARVAVLSYAAKREYRTIEVNRIDSSIVGPFVTIHAAPQNIRPSRYTRARVVGVRRIVVTGPEGTSPVQPIEETPKVVKYGNAMGAQWEVQSVTSKFPIDALRTDSEVHVVYDDGDDVVFRFEMDDVREPAK